MKKKKIWFAAILLLLACAAVPGFLSVRRILNIGKLVDQQNYLASRLMELGEYEQGRTLAAQSEQMKENAVSKELLVLAAGFQSDFESAMRSAEQYLAAGADEILTAAQGICRDFLEKEKTFSREDEYLYQEQCAGLKDSTREALLSLLLQVQKGIDVQMDGVSLQNMMDTLEAQQNGYYYEYPEEEPETLLGRKLQAVSSLKNGNYEQGLEQAQELFEQSGSFEHRALLANAVAGQSNYNVTVDDEGRPVKDQEPVNRAINFIETTTPVTERNSVACQMELSQLYYLAGQPEKSRDMLTGIVKGDLSYTEPASAAVDDFLRSYRMSTGAAEKPAYMDSDRWDLSMAWERVASLMGFVEQGYDYGTDSTYYDFVIGALNSIFNGVIIRNIDATNFPEVKLTVNVSMDLDKALEKRNFTVTEMGGILSDFEFQAAQEQEGTQKLSVALVVDHSGSMSGTPLDDTKKAVSAFVRNIEDGIRVGLIQFDDAAQVVAPVSDNTAAVLRGIAAMQDGGGTSIYSGLELAGNELASENGRRVIILLSDGEDGDSSRIDGVLEELKRKNIYVYTIGFGGADTEYLSYIATSCGGKFLQAESTQVLGEIYASIGQYMENDYIITFTVETEPERFDRIVRVETDVEDAYAEKEYDVGVSPDSILDEKNQRPVADYFQQIGGSDMSGQQE